MTYSLQYSGSIFDSLENWVIISLWIFVNPLKASLDRSGDATAEVDGLATGDVGTEAEAVTALNDFWKTKY